MQTLNLSSNQFKVQVTTLEYPQQEALTYIPYLDGAFDLSLLMGKLRILLSCIEERIALASFAAI